MEDLSYWKYNKHPVEIRLKLCNDVVYPSAPTSYERVTRNQTLFFCSCL